MYTLSQLRRRVDALKRKYALELQILRLHRIAEDFSRQWVRAAGDRQPLPETHAFIRHIADSGFRFHTFMNLHRYLERCRDHGDTPDCWGIIRSLYADQNLDRISQMVDKCHTLAEPEPDEDSDGFEQRHAPSHHRSLIYWADRFLRRYTSPEAIIRCGLHLASRAWQQPKAKISTASRGRGTVGEGAPARG